MHSRCVFAALCLAALFETTSGHLQADEPKGELVGVVVDLDGRPVRNAKVWLESRPATTIAETATPADGRFRLGPLAPVFRQLLLVDAPGFGRRIGKMCRCSRGPSTNFGSSSRRDAWWKAAF